MIHLFVNDKPYQHDSYKGTILKNETANLI